MDNKEQAEAVAIVLRDLVSRVDAITALLSEKRTVTLAEKEQLQELLRALKDDLKSAAKQMPNDPYEEAYLSPAVRKASAHFTIAVNSHPIQSHWHSCLGGVRSDLSFLLYQLEQQLATA